MLSRLIGLKSISVLIVLCLQLNKGLSGDQCPNKHDLWPCTCVQVPVVLETVHRDRKMENLLSVTLPIATTTENSLDIPEEFNFNKQITKLPNSTMDGRNNTYYTVVTCKSLKSISALKDAIDKGLNRKWVDRLTISKVPPKIEHTLATLPEKFLQNLRVSQFEVRDSFLTGDFISEGVPFEGQSKNMLWLTASGCHLSGRLTHEYIGATNTKGMNSLTRLEGVDFSRNLLIYIDTYAFRYPPANLSTVNLSFNSIRAIEANGFSFIPKLRYLDLSHNLLGSVTRNIFASPAKFLQHIDMSWNRLTLLPADFFVAMPALKTVNLQSNFLSALSEKPWATIWRQLSLIQLTGNFLECDCELLWLLDILSPREVNATSTPPPRPLPGQRVFGSCGHTEPQHFKIPYKLTKLTRENINCGD